ncbi:CCA tRNA nucleotidyltransferase [Campylobacter sp. FMV-PI01]|uniref:CCA tRNA nucleotidyltransferase n=1 Tax=Campylobacter portucalensis TaxID=2608384 RepID=A0A6L5WJI5_9BACT|nr:CCA tRNA nucleotidyltransferase [Campylobacter portucalensis]MSN97106.1 CCA tRNA nucleotidyltransferase [Campylobacter portucalensis]
MQVSKKNLKIYQNKDFIEIYELLKPYTKRAYFVGGFVRDFFMKKHSNDVDIEVFDIKQDDFEVLMNKLGAVGNAKSFYVYKYKNFDISLPRIENKTGFGHKGFEIEICNDEKTAAKRRDFTINSIMINIFSGEVFDFYGGIFDIKNKILRVVDEKTFIEDSLRVLRGVQFISRFNLKVDKNSLNLMKNMDLSDLSVYRIQSELRKFFNSKYQILGLDLIYKLNLFYFLFLYKITYEEYVNLRNLIKNGSKFIKNEMYFLYKTLNFLNLDKKKILKRLSLNQVYKDILNQPYFKNITDLNLLEVSLKMPLKNWLGLDNKDLINRAKKFGIYDNKFSSKIKSEDVMELGFEKKELADEIARLKKDEIHKFLENFKA